MQGCDNIPAGIDTEAVQLQEKKLAYFSVIYSMFFVTLFSFHI